MKYIKFSLFVFLASLSLNSWSEEVISIKDIAKFGSQIMQNPEKHLAESEVGEATKEAIKEADKLVEEKNYDLSFLSNSEEEPWLKEARERRKQAGHDDINKIYVFASRGQPESELKDLFREVKGYRDVAVVFRGIYENETILSGRKEIYKLMAGINKEELPTVELDPSKFQKYDVREAPTMVMIRNGKVVSKVKGIYSVDWLRKEVSEKQRTGDLGVYGDVVQVSEPDLIERFKSDVAKIDFAQKKQEIYDTYWDKYDFTHLGRAKDDETRKLDPTFVITQDIKAPDGTMIAQAGEHINPLHKMAFTSKLLVFDATDKDQVEFVKEKAKEFDEFTRVQLITTKIDREKGWEHIQELEEYFGVAIFFLSDFMKDRFLLRKVPSMIEADDNYFYVHEYLVQVQQEIKEG